MTIHLVYPVNQNKIAAPWSMGNHLFKFFKKINYDVKVYQWTSFEKIIPQPGDILIGHAHPNPITCFRRSLKSPDWKKKYLLQPYNEDIYQMSYINNFINEVDYFFAITGEYWFKRIENTIFASWKKKMIRIDMGINTKDYPVIKKKFNSPGKRKFLYIGNDYKFNNFAKNINYLENIVDAYGYKYFGIVGNKSVGRAKYYGWLDFKSDIGKKIINEYDFYIIVSNNDANPTTILESMSWGLIPFCTKQCGYYNKKGIINVPINNIKQLVKILNKYQKMSTEKLNLIREANKNKIVSTYNWEKICRNVFKVIDKDFNIKKNKKIFQSQQIKKKFLNYEKNSQNYYLLPLNIFSYILTSLKFLFLRKIFKL